MSEYEKAAIAVELLKVEVDHHFQRSRFVWRFHLAVWAGFLAASKIVVDLSDTGRTALGRSLSDWGWWNARGWSLLILTAGPVVANLMYLIGWHRQTDLEHAKIEKLYHERARASIGIEKSMPVPETKHYGIWALFAETLMTVFTATLFGLVTFAATG